MALLWCVSKTAISKGGRRGECHQQVGGPGRLDRRRSVGHRRGRGRIVRRRRRSRVRGRRAGRLGTRAGAAIGRAGGQAIFTPLRRGRRSAGQCVDRADGRAIWRVAVGRQFRGDSSRGAARSIPRRRVGPLDGGERQVDLFVGEARDPAFAAARRSYVVNIGSISSLVGQGLTPAYNASKGAVLQLSRSIALDYAADGLRANCICPGITDTPMLRYHLSRRAESRRAAGRAAATRAAGGGDSTARRGEGGAVLVLRGFVGHYRHVVGRRWRLFGDGRVERRAHVVSWNLESTAMQLKLACADFSFPLLGHDQVLDLIAMLGFDGVDIGLFEGGRTSGRRACSSARIIGSELAAKLSDRGLAAGRRVSCKRLRSSSRLRRIIRDARRRKLARDWFLRTLDFTAAHRRPARLGVAGRAFRRSRERSRLVVPVTSWPGASSRRPVGHRVFGRGPRRLDRPAAKPAPGS